MKSIFVWVLALASQRSHSITVHDGSTTAHWSPLVFFLSLSQDTSLLLLPVLWSSLETDVQLYNHSGASLCSPALHCCAQLTNCLNIAFCPHCTCTEVATSTGRCMRCCSHLKKISFFKWIFSLIQNFLRIFTQSFWVQTCPIPPQTSSASPDFVALCM